MPVFTSRAPEGHPNLIDLMTTDRVAATEFYAGLFGWEYFSTHMPGSSPLITATLGGERVAVISEEPSYLVEAGVPPQWQLYLQVDDLATASGRIEAAGGTILAPFATHMGSTQILVAEDPCGAVISFRNVVGDGDSRVENEPGALSWLELVAEEYESTFDFYREIAGLHTATMPMGDGQPAYTLFTAGAESVAGAWPPEQPGTHPHWRVYFEVENLDAALTIARGLGAELADEQGAAQGVGRWAVLSDPQGAAFALLQPE